MSRIVGLNDLKKKEDEEKDPRQEQLFAGGLDQRGGGSGVNVLGPPGPGDDDSSLFGRIRAGAAAADALVNTSSAVSRTVTIYRNGFTVDNGPLRDPTAPENASFLSDLTRGRVPRELVKEAGGDEGLDLNLVDKHEEDWIKPAYVAFSNGNTLGSAVVSEDSFVLDPDIVSTFPTAPEPVDVSQPHTTVQVRTLTGQRLKIKISQSAQILQLAVAISSQYQTNDSYVLTSGYPPVDIKDPGLTIAEAGLLNALVTMRKV